MHKNSSSRSLHGMMQVWNRRRWMHYTIHRYERDWTDWCYS